MFTELLFVIVVVLFVTIQSYRPVHDSPHSLPLEVYQKRWFNTRLRVWVPRQNAPPLLRPGGSRWSTAQGTESSVYEKVHEIERLTHCEGQCRTSLSLQGGCQDKTLETKREIVTSHMLVVINLICTGILDQIDMSLLRRLYRIGFYCERFNSILTAGVSLVPPVASRGHDLRRANRISFLIRAQQCPK